MCFIICEHMLLPVCLLYLYMYISFFIFILFIFFFTMSVVISNIYFL